MLKSCREIKGSEKFGVKSCISHPLLFPYKIDEESTADVNRGSTERAYVGTAQRLVMDRI